MTDNNTAPPPNAPVRPIDPKKMPASAVVRSFLDAMESRDLERARDHLSKDFQMTFPGNAQFSELEELVAWGKARYRSIAKSYTCFDETADGEDAIVYCYGTLSGALPDDTIFKDIRFIDRFTVRGGKLYDQQVWNDMGEVLCGNGKAQ